MGFQGSVPYFHPFFLPNQPEGFIWSPLDNRPFATSTLLANSSSCAGKAKVRSPNSHSMGMVYWPTKSNIHLRQIFRVNMPVLWSIWDSYTSWALMICLSGSILGTILYIEWLESGCLAFQDFRPPPKKNKNIQQTKKTSLQFFFRYLMS